MSSKFGVNSKPAANSDAYRNSAYWDKKDKQKERINICFRCGWCGAPTLEDGTPVHFEKANDMRVDWDNAKPVNGLCCAQQEQEKQNEMMQEIARNEGY